MRYRKGFTLVELSIVLVIIGLLVGGILVGQSLIESAQISSTISQLQQFDSAVDQFKSKYKSLPGDSQYFGGNGNGTIGRTPSSAPTRTDVNAYGNEMVNFWNHLFPDKYPASSWASGAAVIPNKSNAPMAKVGASGSAIIPSAMSTGSFNADMNNKRNYFVILAPGNRTGVASATFTTGTNGSRALKPAQLLSIDKKIDDSVANTGNVIAGRINGDGAGIVATHNTSCSSALGVYDLTKDSYECTPLIRIGFVSGSLK